MLSTNPDLSHWPSMCMTLWNRLTFFLTSFAILIFFRPQNLKPKTLDIFEFLDDHPNFLGFNLFFLCLFFPIFFWPVHDPKYFFKGSVIFFLHPSTEKKCEWKRKMSKEITRRALHVPGPWDPRKERREESLFSFKGKCHLQVHSKPAKHTLFSLNTSILNKYPLLSSGL